jgi:hypothetical protein
LLKRQIIMRSLRAMATSAFWAKLFGRTGKPNLPGQTKRLGLELCWIAPPAGFLPAFP